MLGITMLVALAAAQDADSDGLPDGAEAFHGTDPAEADTDGDSVPDGAEVLVTYTDPLDDTRGCLDWARTTLAPGLFGLSLALADLDADGDLDVAYGGLDATYVGQVGWIENQGGAVFGSPQVVASVPYVDSINAADLDGDGDLDLLAGDEDEAAWYANDGSGGFGAPQPIEGPFKGFSGQEAVADLDGDGDLDVVSRAHWYENLGVGAFAPSQDYGNDDTDGSYSYATADFDDDGDLDILIDSVIDRTGLWPVQFHGLLENLGGAVFAEPIRLEPAAWSLQVTDVDGDGDLDALGPGMYHSVYWWENLGGLAFAQPEVLFDTLDFVFFVQPTDVDGDGLEDFVYATYAINAWARNLGGNEYVGGIPMGAGAGFPLAPYADLDGDGALDVLSGQELMWLHNTLGDADGDGLSEAAEVCIVGTDPDDPDSDGGTVSDHDELWNVTDPFDPTDDLGGPIEPTDTGPAAPTGDTGATADTGSWEPTDGPSDTSADTSTPEDTALLDTGSATDPSTAPEPEEEGCGCQAVAPERSLSRAFARR